MLLSQKINVLHFFAYQTVQRQLTPIWARWTRLRRATSLTPLIKTAGECPENSREAPLMPALPSAIPARSRFQAFTETSNPAEVVPRIAALRAELQRRGLDGFVIPRADQHQGEYVPACDARLAYITGFTGSAGASVVLMDKAALIVDGRYTLQSQEQTDRAVVTPVKMEETGLEAWIETHLPAGAKLGFDPWLHTPDQVKRLVAAVAKTGGELVAVDGNPVDPVWEDRPAAPAAPVRPHPMEHAGQEAADKLGLVREALARARLDALMISDPHNLAWLFNLRGGDVGNTPLPLGYALIPREARAQLFLAPAKITGETARMLAPLADISAPEAMMSALAEMSGGGSRIRLDSATAGEALKRVIETSGGIADVGADPCSLMKARKNAVELEGARRAHLIDGAAMARFLCWLEREAPEGTLTEIDAAIRLEEERIATGELADLSFGSISASGPNAALPHYRVTTTSNRHIGPGIYLIDSGGQYPFGTTDITRTLAIGTPTPEMKDRYTRVLKGHIAISLAVFPKGVSGAQLDAFARAPLWAAGLDFDHGTGHGVGSYLSVHEGPQRLSKLGTTPLEPGMILSNEPGYYREGQFGIRIENLIIVEPRAIQGGEREMFGFETITFCPYDRTLIDRSLLDAGEIAWINAYHAEVLAKIGPLVEGAVSQWLDEACRVL
jgi:Xaa-Pro aminopeptidase